MIRPHITLLQYVALKLCVTKNTIQYPWPNFSLFVSFSNFLLYGNKRHVWSVHNISTFCE